MSKPYYLNDGMKIDAAKLLDSSVMKEIVTVLRARIPDYGNSTDTIETIAAKAKMREGFEMAIDTMLNLPFEGAPPTQMDEMQAALLDPRD